MNPELTKYFAEIWQFLTPENPAALAIVRFLQFACIAWGIGLIGVVRRLTRIKKQLSSLKDVELLVEKRQEHFISGSDESDTNEDGVFDNYIDEKLRKPLKPIVIHLKTIFSAGWNEGRLEVGELLRHTSQQLFRWNHFMRAVLATFIVIGLLGTLFGLADSLAELEPIMENSATSGNNTNEAVIGGLANLLGELKSAFAPSIWGVMFTIVGIILHSAYIRFYALPVQQALERLTLTVWIPRLFPTRSQAETGKLEKSAELINQNVKGVKQIAKFAKNIESKTGQLHDNLDNAITLTASYDNAVEQVNGAAEHLLTFSKQFTENVEKITSFQHEVTALYELMQQGSEDFRNTYGQTLDKQNLSLGSIVSSLKSYEDAYIKERSNIDDKMKKFLDEATEASSSTSTKNREFIEELKTQLVDGLGNVEVALRVQLTALRDKFDELRQPFDKTAIKIDGTFQNFDKQIRTVILEQMLEQFRKQTAQSKGQVDAIQGLNIKIVDLLTSLSRNSQTHGEQLSALTDGLATFTTALGSFGGEIKAAARVYNKTTRKGGSHRKLTTSRESSQDKERNTILKMLAKLRFPQRKGKVQEIGNKENA